MPARKTKIFKLLGLRVFLAVKNSGIELLVDFQDVGCFWFIRNLFYNLKIRKTRSNFWLLHGNLTTVIKIEIAEITEDIVKILVIKK